MSLSIVVATEGKRDSIYRTLRSATSQLAEGDTVIVVGPRDEKLTLAFPTVTYVATTPHHDWGHSERNIGLRRARGTHVLFIDDDDAYLPGALTAVRRALAKRPRNCHMFRMIDLNGLILWQTPEFKQGNVGTPMFVVPNVTGMLGTWGHRYEGDYDFMVSTLANYATTTNPGSDTIVWDSAVIVGCRTFGGVW